MNTKLKIATFLLLLFAGLLVFVTVEHAPRLRLLIPIAGVFMLGYLIYCAWTLLRNSKALDTDATGTDVRCGDGCGCHATNTRPEPPKAAKKVSK